jgi:hypothetical protein
MLYSYLVQCNNTTHHMCCECYNWKFDHYVILKIFKNLSCNNLRSQPWTFLHSYWTLYLCLLVQPNDGLLIKPKDVAAGLKSTWCVRLLYGLVIRLLIEELKDAFHCILQMCLCDWEYHVRFDNTYLDTYLLPYNGKQNFSQKTWWKKLALET